MATDVIKKAKNGTYYFRANIGHDVNGKKIQKYCSGFKTIKEAKAEYSKLILTSPEEFIIEEEKKKPTSFKSFIDDIFIDWYKSQVKLRTFESRLPAIRKHFKYFDKFAVNEIEPIHVQKWQLKLAKEYTPSYVRSIHGLFSIAMDRAIVLGLAETNAGRVVGNVKKRKVKIEFWTKKEFEQVLSVIYKDDYYQHFIFMSFWLLFMTGMRIGEATALQWEDINFDTGVIRITKTLYYKNINDYQFVEPKTRASIRDIVLDSDTLALLKEWQERQQDILDTGFIMSYNGFPTQKSCMSHAITRFSKLAGVHRIKTHALRHSHASLLISMGENPLIIKDRLGHEDIETTLGTYGHLYPNSNFEVASKLKGIIAQNTAQENVDIHASKNQFTASY